MRVVTLSPNSGNLVSWECPADCVLVTAIAYGPSVLSTLPGRTFGEFVTSIADKPTDVFTLYLSDVSQQPGGLRNLVFEFLKGQQLFYYSQNIPNICQLFFEESSDLQLTFSG